MKLTDFSDAFAKMLNYNALNCLLNNGAITDSSQLKFHLYHLRNTDQNAPYYNIPDSDSYIYVVLNRKQVIWFLIVLNSSGNLPSQEEWVILISNIGQFVFLSIKQVYLIWIWKNTNKTITLYLQRLQVEGCSFASGILIKGQSSNLPWSQPSER